MKFRWSLILHINGGLQSKGVISIRNFHQEGHKKKCINSEKMHKLMDLLASTPTLKKLQLCK